MKEHRTPNEKSEHELRAISFARELIDKFEVFDDFVSNVLLDDVGIDLVFIKHFGKKEKIFRFHIQLKPNAKAAENFKKHNPCVPVWIVHKSAKPEDAIVSLLEIVSEVTFEAESQYAGFFKEKLTELKNIFSFNPR